MCSHFDRLSKLRRLLTAGLSLPSSFGCWCMQFGVTSDDIRTRFEAFGDVKTFFDMLERRGMAFITYVRSKCSEHHAFKLTLDLLATLPSLISAQPCWPRTNSTKFELPTDRSVQLLFPGSIVNPNVSRLTQCTSDRRPLLPSA